MTEARFTLTIPALTHDGANALASALEENFRIDPMAITINETDEARGLWEVVLYFETEQDAADARELEELKGGAIAPMPQEDWVRRSLEGSLRRLGTDHVDVYLIHWPNPSVVRYVETWRTMLEPRRLFMRYAVTNIHAIWLMAKHRRDLRAGGTPAPGPR